MSKTSEVRLNLREIIFNMGCCIDLDRWEEEGKGYIRVVHVSDLRECRHSCTLYKERSIFEHLSILSTYLQEVGARGRAQQIKQLLNL